MTHTREYQIICIYGGPEKGKDAISTLDGAPGYLHMHILDSELLGKGYMRENGIPAGEPGVLYQWGILFDKDSHTRSVKVTDSEARKYGNIGIGSAWGKDKEGEGNSHGGGEGFVYGEHSYRITRGNSAFKISGNEGYWTLQVSAFKDAITTDKVKQALSREDLKKQLLDTLGGEDVPFIATFRARFNASHFIARSNGILTADEVQDRNQIIFGGNEAVYAK